MDDVGPVTVSVRVVVVVVADALLVTVAVVDGEVPVVVVVEAEAADAVLVRSGVVAEVVPGVDCDRVVSVWVRLVLRLLTTLLTDPEPHAASARAQRPAIAPALIRRRIKSHTPFA